jgi:predicted 3-demethylubiquinone-9 3-methyltransferase (glyoxalase superfamily)
MTNPIYPCLWFDNQALAAAEFYLRVFDNSRITSNTNMVVAFDLSGQKFIGLNGGPIYVPNPSISFFVLCESIEEIDQTWNKFMDGGKVMMPLDTYPWSEKYGWIQDRFGISWQLYVGKMQDVGQKISPLLMFANNQNGKAEEAVHFYTSVFENSALDGIARYSADDDDVAGNVVHAQFKLGSHIFMAMDTSKQHMFDFNEGISIVVECENQQEIDYYWDQFTKGGQESMCGWLKDKYGVSWQIIPAILPELLNDPLRAERVTKAFLQMRKFDIEKLLSAK